jgi:hypothetical protein
MMDCNGKPVPGFELKDGREIYGDEIERVVDWDLSGIAGKVVQLRFVLKDADLYSFRFR